ncbi:hypothetical protein NLJ89_g6122 [Agrocybe chaxingu]|uniref:Uncharacterized protein n=1 Tax=Agrocybe chaxingu TaxID=84603 RepID=A0A9W8JZR2_9AGAR|nr:hypothetical protein NLJ89_g6122 [Agrocybe chaxingu]
MAPVPLDPIPLENSKFNLDIFSVAGFFGGDEVVEAMATLHLYKGRKWRGWYNSPGAYTVAKHLGRIADSRFWRALFPGAWRDPATAFSLDGKEGPKYLAVLSGTEMPTGHAGYLLAESVKKLAGKDLWDRSHRRTASTSVTIVDIKRVIKLDNLSVSNSPLHLLISYFTMLSSVACAVFSFLFFNDKFCFFAILLGTLIGGISSLVIGMGSLSLESVFKPAPGSPPGDGVLLGQSFIVLRGSESDVNAITKGKFCLHMANHPSYHNIGVCALLYFLQFLAQLFLIPQGNLPGQLMYLASFVIAWINNCVIASIDKEEVQTNLLADSVSMETMKFAMPNRTTAVVFTCLALRRAADEKSSCPAYKDFEWRRIVLQVLESKSSPEYLAAALNEPEIRDLRHDQQELLKTLLHDADKAYKKYNEITSNGGVHGGQF